MNRVLIQVSFFSIVLGLCGLGSAWRAAAYTWHLPPTVGEYLMIAATLIWLLLSINGLWTYVQRRHHIVAQFQVPISAGSMALPGIATLLIVQAIRPWSAHIAEVVLAAGLAWHLAFAVWHTSALWQGGHKSEHLNPTLYLPTVAGNLTAAGALGAMGQTDYAWLFFGAGVCSWLALEPLVLRRLWHDDLMPMVESPTLGIQFAPPAVAAAALFTIEPTIPAPLIFMLVGYSVFQLLGGFRTAKWSLSPRFSPSWWSWTFGLASATTICIKLSLQHSGAATFLAIILFLIANLFIGWLVIQTLYWFFRAIKQSPFGNDSAV